MHVLFTGYKSNWQTFGDLLMESFGCDIHLHLKQAEIRQLYHLFSNTPLLKQLIVPRVKIEYIWNTFSFLGGLFLYIIKCD